MRNGNKIVQAQDTIVLTQDTMSAAFPDLPDQLSFRYAAADGVLVPEQHSLRPLQEDADGYSWRAASDDNWLSLAPANGSAADVLEIRPALSSADAVAESNSTVTLTLYDTAGAVLDSHAIRVSLDVVEGDLHSIYVPLAQK